MTASTSGLEATGFPKSEYLSQTLVILSRMRAPFTICGVPFMNDNVTKSQITCAPTCSSRIGDH